MSCVACCPARCAAWCLLGSCGAARHRARCLLPASPSLGAANTCSRRCAPLALSGCLQTRHCTLAAMQMAAPPLHPPHCDPPLFAFCTFCIFEERAYKRIASHERGGDGASSGGAGWLCTYRGLGLNERARRIARQAADARGCAGQMKASAEQKRGVRLLVGTGEVRRGPAPEKDRQPLLWGKPAAKA